MAIKLTIHGIQAVGIDSLTGKEGETLLVSFEDGTVSEAALSQRSMMQLLRMKLAMPAKTASQTTPKPAVPAALPVGNGPAE